MACIHKENLRDNLNVNPNKSFIHVTEAKVYTYHTNEKIEHVDLIEANKTMIQAIFPIND